MVQITHSAHLCAMCAASVFHDGLKNRSVFDKLADEFIFIFEIFEK
jgi:hypothetical protein